jgi:hypothetical protein
MRDLEYVSQHLHRLPWIEDKNYTNKHKAAFPELKKPDYAYAREFPDAPGPTVTSRLADLLVNTLPWQLSYSRSRQVGPNMTYTEPSRFVYLLAGLLLALCSASFVVAPVVVMLFSPSRTKSLITLGVSILCFAFFSTYVVMAKSMEVFGATMAYAAVLVVFIGTSGVGGG